MRVDNNYDLKIVDYVIQILLSDVSEVSVDYFNKKV